MKIVVVVFLYLRHFSICIAFLITEMFWAVSARMHLLANVSNLTSIGLASDYNSYGPLLFLLTDFS